MATASQIINGALDLLGVKDPREALNAAEADNSLGVLNRMLARWVRDGVAVPFVELTAVTDDLIAPTQMLEAIEYNLAVRMAPRYGVAPRADVVAMADDGYSALLRDSQGWDRVDLSHMPNVRDFFDINNG